jgi:hypothetical protein
MPFLNNLYGSGFRFVPVFLVSTPFGVEFAQFLGDEGEKKKKKQKKQKTKKTFV